jgi:UDP-3-O-[3-hydroxymyristoyl] glucosamine N-acyltransferase
VGLAVAVGDDVGVGVCSAADTGSLVAVGVAVSTSAPAGCKVGVGVSVVLPAEGVAYAAAVEFEAGADAAVMGVAVNMRDDAAVADGATITTGGMDATDPGGVV